MSNIVLCLWHSIEEYDQVRLLSSIGYNVFSVGAYADPAHPGDDMRPALPDVPFFADLKAATDAVNAAGGEAKEALPAAVLDWADIIIYHHRLGDLFDQWDPTIARWLASDSAHRVIWRTVGQSVASNEAEAAPFRARGLEVVRYSPKEENIPGYVGRDALIRFYKDPAEWNGWIGDEPIVTTVAQDMERRDNWCNYDFWGIATDGLPAVPLGKGSEVIGGPGKLGWEEMRERLRHARAYLYTGTQPASYTLGLIEAMMIGIPVVSIGPSWMTAFPYGPALFEGHEIAVDASDDPNAIREVLRAHVEDRANTGNLGMLARHRAIDLFGRDKIAAEWAAYLR